MSKDLKTCSAFWGFLGELTWISVYVRLPLPDSWRLSSSHWKWLVDRKSKTMRWMSPSYSTLSSGLTFGTAFYFRVIVFNSHILNNSLWSMMGKNFRNSLCGFCSTQIIMDFNFFLWFQGNWWVVPKNIVILFLSHLMPSRITVITRSVAHSVIGSWLSVY